MERDAWFFIGVFVFIFLIWIATGGPLRRPAVVVPTPPNLIASTTLSGNGTYLQLPRSPYAVGTAGLVCLPGSTDCSGQYGTSGSPAAPGVRNPGSVPSGVPGVSLTPASEYRNVISIRSYVINASSTDPKTEYVQIAVAQNAPGPVDITKWVLVSGATGNAAVIPKGTRIPTSGVINASEDIVLQPGQSAVIVSGESPVGSSFLENKCIGYFGSLQQFSPSLPQNCPSASEELSAAYGTPYIHDPSCIDYTRTLARCQTALAPKSANLSLTCQDFLENRLNYNGCLATHRADSDFNGTTWHIYLGRKTHLWRSKYEVVELLDDHGRTVASFNY